MLEQAVKYNNRVKNVKSRAKKVIENADAIYCSEEC